MLDVTTHNEGPVMVFDLLYAASLRSIIEHGDTQRPFVNHVPARKRYAGSDVLILLEECGSDEWLDNEPSTKVDALKRIAGVVPGLIERRGVRLCLSAVVVWIERVVDPYVKGSEESDSQSDNTRQHAMQLLTETAKRIDVSKCNVICGGNY